MDLLSFAPLRSLARSARFVIVAAVVPAACSRDCPDATDVDGPAEVVDAGATLVDGSADLEMQAPGVCVGVPNGVLCGVETATCDESRCEGGECVPAISPHPDLELDTGFGTGGLATFVTPGTDYDSRSHVLATQPDGKLILGGEYYRAAFGRTMSLVRLMPNGTVDTTFGEGGYVANLFAVPSTVYSLDILDDGAILVGGQREGHVALLRLRPDGTLDGSFGDGGSTVNPDISVSYNARDHVAVEASGRILAAGSGGGNFKIVAYDAGGVLDERYADGGVATIDIDGGDDVAHTLALQGDGRLLVAGVADDRFGIGRLHVDGTLDANFGVGGVVRTNVTNGPDPDILRDLVVLGDDRLLAIGCGNCGLNYTDDAEWALVRYMPDGALDATFGMGGIEVTEIPDDLVVGSGSSDGAAAALALPSGHVLVAGWTKFNDAAGRWLIARYRPDGAVDTCFDVDGFHVQESWGSVLSQGDVPEDLLMQTDGKVVIAGTIDPSAWGEMAVLRMLP